MTVSEVEDLLRVDENYYGGIGKKYLSNSNISQILADPLGFGEEESELTQPLVVGSLFHHMIEAEIKGDESLLKDNYEIVGEDRMFVPVERGVVTKDEFEACTGWVANVLANKTVKKLVTYDIDTEVPKIGKIYGARFKCKSDLLVHGPGPKLIIDWKTTNSEVSRWVRGSFDKYGYDSASYIYQELNPGYEMIFVVVDKNKGKVRIHKPAEYSIYNGKEKVASAIKLLEVFKPEFFN